MNYCIKRQTEVVRKIKGSKFIARTYPVASREAAQQIIQQNEQEHRKATHVCWAYRITYDDDVLGYSSDAGEPRGSAGPPILASLEGCQLSNSLCIVIRYFGGTKLGIGGLIRAYGSVAAAALDRAGRQRYRKKIHVKIRIDQSRYSELMRLLRKYRLSVQPKFEGGVVFVYLEITQDELQSLKTDLRSITSAEIISGDDRAE